MLRLTTGSIVGVGAVMVSMTMVGVREPAYIVLAAIGVLVVNGVVGWQMAALPVRRALRRIADVTEQLHRVDTAEGRLVRAVRPDDDMAELIDAVNGVLERMEVEREELQQRVDVSTRILEATPSGVMLVDGQGRIHYRNSTFERLIELRGEPMSSRPMEVGAPAEVQTGTDRALRGETVDDLYCVSGAFDLSVSAVPMADGAMVIVHDITRFRRAERARTDFVANVSHELRTPIAAIIGYTETLLTGRDGLHEDTAMMVDVIQRNGDRLRSLFEDLLALHRIESRRRELPLERHRLRPLLTEALQPSRDRALQRGQTLDLRCAADLEALVNEHALQSIVANLAGNASNYTPKGGKIVVTAECADAEVTVEVTDNGIGIAPSAHARIFERFFRVDAGRSREVGGTGLGLAIVKHLAMASGCRVSVRSEEGDGSAFTVHIPIQPEGEVPP